MTLTVTTLKAADPSECPAKHLDDNLSILFIVSPWGRVEFDESDMSHELMTGTAREVIDHLIHEYDILNDADEPYYYAQTDTPSDILTQLLKKLNSDEDTFELIFM